MSMITSRGQAAADSITKEKLSVKDEYITLKADEAVVVRILGAEDYVGYMSHSSYNLSIFTQPCPDPQAKTCEYCKAASAGIEAFQDLRLKPRYTFGFAELGERRIKLLDVSKNQAKKLLVAIEEYADVIDEMPFTLRRVGSGTDTAYSLSPIIKAKPNQMDAFHSFDGETIDLEFFSDRLEAKVSTPNFKIKLLSEASFPTDMLIKMFGKDVVEDALAASPTDKPKSDAISASELDDIV